MKIKNTLSLKDNPTSMVLLEDNNDCNFHINYKCHDIDDFNTYIINLYCDINDKFELANLMRDIADYLDETEEDIINININCKRDD